MLTINLQKKEENLKIIKILIKSLRNFTNLSLIPQKNTKNYKNMF